MKVGILALQGAVQDHEAPLRKLGADCIQVRTPRELSGIDGLILPGGESTVMGLYLREYGLVPAIRGLAEEGLPIWGLCAGAILLCSEVDGKPGVLALLQARARRNAYGRQSASFEEEIQTEAGPFPGIFIRAPRLEALGDSLVIGWRKAESGRDREAVLLRSGNILAASFHPELGGDPRLHGYFLDICQRAG